MIEIIVLDLRLVWPYPFVLEVTSTGGKYAIKSTNNIR